MNDIDPAPRPRLSPARVFNGVLDEALLAIEARKPHLVVLDIWLQGSRLDGLEILNIIRKVHPDLPVIEEQDQPVKMLWDWQVFDFDGWVVPADIPADRADRVMHFLNFATDTQRLADQAKYISYGPARASSQPLVGQHAELGIEMAQHMPTNPDNQKNYLVNNIEWWADNQDDVEARFQAWLTQ